MAAFDSSSDYYNFAHYVKRKARHVLNAQWQRFIETVLATSKSRRLVIHTGSALWRAQLGHVIAQEIEDPEYDSEPQDTPAPFPKDRMKPLVDRACEGRVNPKGIACLYLSNDRDTAMTETRPWVGSYVSVAGFVLLRDITVVDCTMDGRPPVIIPGEEPEPAEREKDIWWHINQAFSEPVTRADDVADYAPTQVLAEAFRSDGCDGILYGSRLGIGKNLAVFDLAAADLGSCHLYEVKAIEPTYSEAAIPYYIHRYAGSLTPPLFARIIRDDPH